MKNTLLVAFFLISNLTCAFQGEVKEINHSNLVKFNSVQSDSCIDAPPGYAGTGNVAWLYIDYQDGATARRLAHKIVLWSQVSCDDAKDSIKEQLKYINLDLNDVLVNNTSVSEHVCVVKYLVATLDNPITLSNGSTADLADYVVSRKAVKCP